ncbi:GntR family transcriptional regulator [Lapidilactobacillus achengensis]|uniref:GntR family transcriptional regulator n=1 Tax=Lapidilactobacillus achengensis TaxID=2486000 RepID=A0ABW1UQ96_9LACO|nr:GntR family transcriptional regulator [Lapidilactobacillus achengensis]
MNPRVPKYRSIAQTLEKQILKDVYQDGELLPSESQLMTQFSVSRITVRKAIEILKEKHLVVSAQGLGNIVKRRYEHELSEVKDLHASFVPEGIVNKVIAFRVERPNDIARKKLALSNDDQVYYVTRQRFFEERLIIVEICYLPVKLFPNLSYQALEDSIFGYVESVDHYRIADSDDEILPDIVHDELAALLEVPAGTAVLKIESTNYLSDGRPFQYSIAYHRSDNYRLKIHIDQSR